jgi:hypothetical protein
LELEKGRGKLLGISELYGESICARSASVSTKVQEDTNHTSFKLKLAAENVHQELDDSIHGSQSIREQEESNHDGHFLVEAK